MKLHHPPVPNPCKPIYFRNRYIPVSVFHIGLLSVIWICLKDEDWKHNTIPPMKRFEDRFHHNYIFNNRFGNLRGVSKRIKLRAHTVSRMVEDELSRKSYCSKCWCFKASNKRFLRSKMVLYLNLRFEKRRASLTVIIGSNGCFFFDFWEVSGKFLLNSFRFSRYKQSKVGSNLMLEAYSDFGEVHRRENRGK